MRMKPNLIFYRRVFLLVCFMGLSFSATVGAQNANIVAHDAWARVPLKSKMDTALYMVVENHTSQNRTIVSVSTESAAQAELHQMTMIKMMMVMTPVDHVAIPARGKTSFDPNGFHIMLFGLKTRPDVGDKLSVTLKLDDG